jgi:hypothetical protein
MNRKNRAPLTILVLATSVSFTGCATHEEPAATKADVPTPAAFRTAACNLGAYWDSSTQAVRAKYSDPTIDDSIASKYGSVLANNTCSDADILSWQALRRALDEDDTICRVVWFDDLAMASVYDIGCAVPVVVTDAAR